ncbi:single-stranded DNA-binding protein [Columbid alphaherpesvirus 1]|uniref:Single-stranded DNA-binding protein n=1 Tax=Columbid alphaherpesvirus 1 TaxID=93386 RepID=A0A1V0M8H5_9ALPH|nr:single-stranded DNA-binding protein [Columbid alphaherpesvirus 1]ARD71354.1 single-stranded DNA-binding protein [Columbid alphaherpesvirus 1]
MESSTNVQVKGGPLGYVYAMPKKSMESADIALLAARSVDSDAAVLPLARNLTVEAGFATNVAAVAGARTTGLGGSGVTVKLVPTHYHPSVFIFHGGASIKPSTRAPNLTLACENARTRFGFSAYSPPAEASKETTGRDICDAIGCSAEDTVLYLAVTQLFREAVYLCNTFLHYKGAEKVTVGEWDATRIPMYPLHLSMPDFNRVNAEPFNQRHRSLADGAVLPKAFYNDALCRLLHGCILGPSGVALRVRNLDAVARGAAHLSFDENHEGTLLPNDVTFTAFESAQERGSGKSSGRQAGGRGQGAEAGSSGASGFERRTASIMASDTTLSIESIISASVYEETAPDFYTWPILTGSTDEGGRAEALASYMARVAGLVGAMVFSSNSALYMTEIDDAGGPEGKDGAGTPSFYRFFQFAGPHLAGNPQTDREGRVTAATRDRQSVPVGGTANQEFSIDYLAMACGFSPQYLARMLFYLERCDSGAAAYRHESDTLKHVAGAIDSEVACELCERGQRVCCANTTVYRLRYRLPRFGNPTRGSMGLFGAMTSNYSDSDVLGNYAPFSALKKVEGDTARTVMQDTYRVTVERVTAELDKAGLLVKENPSDPASLDSAIRDGKTFMNAITTLRQAVEKEANQLMQNLVELRDYKIREGLADANHTLFLAIEPYSAGLCPLLALLARRSLLAVLQDMALSQCSLVMHGQQVEARNFRTQFQSVLRRRVLDLHNAGFITSRNVTVTLADQTVVAPDTSQPSEEAPQTEVDGDLVKVSVEVFKELKVKSRVMFVGGATSGGSEAARARLAGMAEAYQRPDTRTDVLNGALGFAIKRYHAAIFPKGGPPSGSVGPNAQWFWAMLQRNQMPARLLSRDDIAAITYIKRFTDEYAAMNYINIPPTCIGELAQFYLANIILKFCDHKHFYISSVTALTATSRRPKDPSAVLQWIDSPIGGGADVEPAAREILKNLDRYPDAWTSTFSSSNLVRSYMSYKPLIVLGLSISKYHGMAGSTRVFQAGNWGNLNGGKNVCPLMAFDRTRRYVLVCPRIGFVVQSSGLFNSGVREKTLSDQTRAIIAEGGTAPHAAIYIMAIKTIGDRVRDMGLDDWVSLTEDEYVSTLLCGLNDKAGAGPGGWSVDAALAVAKEAECSAQTHLGEAEAAFDFNACDEEGDAVQFAPPSCSTEALKRPNQDSLFDLGPVPEKKSALSIDML